MRIIDQVLSENAIGTTGIKSFGHGNKFYANLNTETFKNHFPRIWIYDTRPLIKVTKSGSLNVSYRVLGGIQKPVEISESAANLHAEMDILEPMLIEFIQKVISDARVDIDPNNPPSFDCEESWHMLDANVVELAFAFNISVGVDIPCI